MSEQLSGRKQRDLRNLLLGELVLIGVVMALFAVIPARLIAGLLAGALFIALGVWVNVLALRWTDFYKHPTFWAGELHLFGSAIPLFVSRLIRYQMGFESLTLFGIAAPVFHRISTLIYGVLVLATCLDWWRASRNRATPSQR